jgi:hypothetical protein
MLSYITGYFIQVYYSVKLVSFLGVVFVTLESWQFQLFFWEVAVDGASNHLVEFEIGVAFLTILLVEDVLTQVVCAPHGNDALELCHVFLGDHIVNVQYKIENRSA